jgi:hypothetical protein
LYAAEAHVTKKRSSENEKAVATESEVVDDLMDVAVRGLNEQGKVLFIDDFHSLEPQHKKPIAQQLKDAALRQVRVCLAEVPHRSNEPLEHQPDLQGRIATVNFEYWRQEDLVQIAEKGFLVLGAAVPTSTAFALALEAGGSPQLMQLLCLELCAHLGIEETNNPPRQFSVTLNDLEVACIDALNSIKYQVVQLSLERGTSDASLRRRLQSRTGVQFDMHELSLAALALDPPQHELRFDAGNDNMLRRITSLLPPGTTIGADEVAPVLKELAETALRINPDRPYLDFTEVIGLSVLDPYLLFHLRWCAKYFALRKAVQALI